MERAPAACAALFLWRAALMHTLTRRFLASTPAAPAAPAPAPPLPTMRGARSPPVPLLEAQPMGPRARAH